MHEVRVGYRFLNNEVQGFVGAGLTAKQAKAKAINKVTIKLSLINEPYHEERLIFSHKGLTANERMIIEEDFVLSQQARNDC